MDSYLIAVTPPSNISRLVEEYRSKCRVFTNYVIPPHITIYPPFYIDVSEEQVIKQLGTIGLIRDSIILDSIDTFEDGNNVIFFKPNITSQEKLSNLFSLVKLSISGIARDKYLDYHSREYSPHMTIVERVPNDLFNDLKSSLSSSIEKISFELSSIDLYRQVSGSTDWILIHRFLI